MPAVEKEIWSDLHPDLKVGADGGITKVINVDAVYASVENIILTLIGSRVMLRNFASNFYQMLFEPLRAQYLKSRYIDEFRNHLEVWEPRIKVDSLDVEVSPDQDTLRVRIGMYIRGYDQIFTFEGEYKQ